MTVTVDLRVLEQTYAICRLAAGSPVPEWAHGTGFSTVIHCDDELSIVCPAQRVPNGIDCDRDWAALKLTGSFAFDETGVVLAVVRPLSDAGLGVFVVSTFSRDYLLVKLTDLARARALLEACGHRFES